MARVVTRAGWGAVPARCSTPLDTAETVGVAVHYSATAADLERDGAAVMREHQGFHMRPESQGGRGWCDVAYSFEVDRRGTIFEGRGWHLRTAANGTNTANDGYYAVCYQGADKAGRQDFTREAALAFADLFRAYRALTGRWPSVSPHSAFTSTECPGDEIRAWVALAPWRDEATPSWPLPLPPWWWRWNAWRLGEGAFAAFGPRAPAARHLTGAPANLGGVRYAWVWARAAAFDRARARARAGS